MTFPTCPATGATSSPLRCVQQVADESSRQRQLADRIGGKRLKDADPASVLQVPRDRQPVHLNVIDASDQVVEYDGHARTADGHQGHIVGGATVQGARVTVILNAVQRLRRVAVQHIYADVGRMEATNLLFPTMTAAGRQDDEYHMAIPRKLQLLHTRTIKLH